jgi:signal peptidase II
MERSSPEPRPPATGNGLLFWPVFLVLLLTDFVTKAVAVYALGSYEPPRPVLGNGLRWVLVYNPGAAFGFHLGPYSRWIFMVLTAGALYVLWRLYQDTVAGDRPRTVALAMVCAGALGNLIDRIRSPRGVVDFIDVGFGDTRWPTFNVADIAVSTGAFLLAWVLWGEDQRAAAATAAELRTPADARDAESREAS